MNQPGLVQDNRFQLRQAGHARYQSQPACALPGAMALAAARGVAVDGAAIEKAAEA